jgi:hypothetical protein
MLVLPFATMWLIGSLHWSSSPLCAPVILHFSYVQYETFSPFPRNLHYVNFSHSCGCAARPPSTRATPNLYLSGRFPLHIHAYCNFFPCVMTIVVLYSCPRRARFFVFITCGQLPWGLLATFPPVPSGFFLLGSYVDIPVINRKSP